MPGQQEASPAGLPADVNQPEETEGLRRTSLTSSQPLRVRIAPELDESRLVGVQFQLELAQPLPQVLKELPPVFLVLEAHHEVIGVAHDRDFSACHPLSPLVDP